MDSSTVTSGKSMRCRRRDDAIEGEGVSEHPEHYAGVGDDRGLRGLLGHTSKASWRAARSPRFSAPSPSIKVAEPSGKAAYSGMGSRRKTGPKRSKVSVSSFGAQSAQSRRASARGRRRLRGALGLARRGGLPIWLCNWSSGAFVSKVPTTSTRALRRSRRWYESRCCPFLDHSSPGPARTGCSASARPPTARRSPPSRRWPSGPSLPAYPRSNRLRWATTETDSSSPFLRRRSTQRASAS